MVNESVQQEQEEASDPETGAKRLIELSINPCLCSIVAGNPGAPASLLERLAEDHDHQVRQAVASNPNTPWATLERLADEFPREFLRNPVGPLQMLARPDQISTKETFWGVLLRDASLPALWWNWLKSHPLLSKSLMVLLHVQYAETTRQPCDFSQDEPEQALLALTTLLTAADEQQMGRPLSEHQTGSEPSMTQYQHIIKESLQRLAQSDDPEVRQAVVAHPQTSEEVLQSLARDEDPLVRKGVAEQKRTSEAILCKLAQDTNPLVRQAVASQERIPVEVLHVLAKDTNECVRLAVARRASIPMDIIRILVQDTRALNRSTALSHLPIPRDVLCDLAQDTEVSVRCSVAEHPQTPNPILQMLSRDQNEHVRCSVAEHPQTPNPILQQLCLDPHEWVRKAVASHPHVTDKILSMLAQDTALSVRYAVASNPQTSEDIFQQLSHDPQERVRRAVAFHPRTPERILHVLAQDTEMNVRWLVASNPQTPEDIFQQLSRDPEEAVRQAIAENPHASEKVLHTLANNEPQNRKSHHNVGLAVAMHPQASVETLYLLTDYPDRQVQLLARFVQKLLARYGNKVRKQAWWSKLSRFFIEDKSAWIGTDTFSIETLLEKIAALDIPENVRQMVITPLAAHWENKHTFAVTGQRDAASILRARVTFYKHLLDPLLPPLALQKLAISPHWEVRYLMAIHKKTSWKTRQQLRQDGNRYVRLVARTDKQ